jgi:mannose-6-phosphate isomerase
MITPFKLNPEYRDYVWGGTRLRPEAEQTAEAWVVYEGNQISEGSLAGLTLAEAAEKEPNALLGARPLAQTGNRFPLLIKLLDCAQWLSLQVHPNDAQARTLEGSGHFGKTEAWYIIEADDGAQLISGFRQGTTCEMIEEGVRGGKILDLVERRTVRAGDAIFISPGTIHALGPGLLLYEVQQTSDITYRVYDWDRKPTPGRQLHIEQAIKVLNPEEAGEVLPAGGQTNLAASQYFKLEKITGGPAAVNNKSQSFSLLTVVDSNICVIGEGWELDLERFETLVVPAVCSDFRVETGESGCALHAYVPPGGHTP